MRHITELNCNTIRVIDDNILVHPFQQSHETIYDAQNYLIKRELDIIEKAKQNIKEIRELYDI
jgi:hypothetical protein